MLELKLRNILIKIWDDYLIDDGEYIGIILEIENVWIYILDRNVHSWLTKFGDFYIGYCV